MSRTVTAVEALDALATRDPAAVALRVMGPGGVPAMSRVELVGAARQAAGALAARGAGPGRWVALALPTGATHVVAALGAWWTGAGVLPLAPRLPAPERDGLLRAARPVVVVSEWTDRDDVRPADLLGVAADGPPVPQHQGRAIGTGGSTGAPRLIVTDGPYGLTDDSVDLLAHLGMLAGERSLLALPLHHSFGFDWLHHGLQLGQDITLLEGFDAVQWLDAVERVRPSYAVLVPTMMRRVLQVPGVEERDLSSLVTLLHSGGPCPPAVKRGWCELIGPERVLEAYGATEGYGNTTVRGDEWLARPGSVGRPTPDTELRIVDDSGRPVPAGTTGEVQLRRGDGAFRSVGDLGRLDDDGWLFLSDRRVDLVVTGGANVYPAEVEAVLLEHPKVADVAVVGVADDEWGQRVHAVVQPLDSADPPTLQDLVGHCRSALLPYKAPRSMELRALLPRDDAGKLRRSALVPT